MKICVEAKKRKHFKKLTEKYFTGGSYDCWWQYKERSCIDIDDGVYCLKGYFEEDNYKILTYKQWKAVMEGGKGVAIRVKEVEQFNEVGLPYGHDRDSNIWEAYQPQKIYIKTDGFFCSKGYFKNNKHLILSYKEWKAIRGENK